MPEEYQPSPLLPAEVIAAVRVSRGLPPQEAPAAEVGVGADGAVEDKSTAFMHKLDDGPLTWVDVPSDTIAAWLELYFTGKLRPVATTTA